MNIEDIYFHLYHNLTDVKLYLPDYQWAQASSVLVNGFDGFEPITTPQSTQSTQSTTQSTQSTSESTQRPTTTYNPFNSASRTNNLSFTFLSTFLILFILVL